jgi:hypothetical protein
MHLPLVTVESYRTGHGRGVVHPAQAQLTPHGALVGELVEKAQLSHGRAVHQIGVTSRARFEMKVLASPFLSV